MKKLIGVLFILLVTMGVGAQIQDFKKPVPEIAKRMKLEKISFLATFLDLTPEEAQVFWPVYNEFERKKFELEVKKREIEFKVNGKLASLSEEDMKNMNNEFIKTFSEEAALMKEYNKKFQEVIPLPKVLKLYQAERRFRAHMLKEFRNRKLKP